MAVSRIVVYGGTFDPFHNGHLAVARCLLGELDADTVVIVPTGRPWLRANPPVASSEDRLTMAQLATEGEHGIEVSDVDIVREGTTYSIDTITDLRRVYGDDPEYLLAIGSDSAAELHRWYRHEDLLNACTIVVVQRPGAASTSELRLPSETIHVEGPMIDVSASALRTLYGASRSSAAATFVPRLTHRFIIEGGLYR